MRFDLKLAMRTTLVCLLAATFALPQNMFADSHVVSSADLQKQAVAASQTRQQNIQDVRQFLSTPAAQKALNNAKVNSEQVKTAVSQLNEDDRVRIDVHSNLLRA